MNSPVDPAATPPQSARVVNLPNALTLLRLAVVPVFAALLFAEGGMDDDRRYWATLVFALAIITDRYDGMIARRTGQVTEFGKLADPIADKALTGTALIGLYTLPFDGLFGTLRWWVMAAAVVLTVVTGLDYVHRALALRRTSARAMRAAAARRSAGPAGGPRTDAAA